MPHWLKLLSNLNCLFSQALVAFIIIAFNLFLLLILICGFNLWLVLLIILIFDVLFFCIFTLLNKLLCIQWLSHFYTKLQMLSNKILQLLCSHLLSLAFIFNIIIMLHDFLTRLPIQLYNVWHELTLSLQFHLLLPQLAFLCNLFLMNVSLAISHHLLGILCFLLALLIKVISHPNHFFK